MTRKIQEVEPQFAQKLSNPLKNILQEFSYSLPEHYQPRVFLLDANGRKKRSSASAENWSPEFGRIEIRFERGSSEDPGFVRTTAVPSLIAANDRSRDSGGKSEEAGSREVRSFMPPTESDLLNALMRALANAESRPGWNFVPLKKFRDEILPAEHVASMRTEEERQNALRLAIEKRFVVIGRVPNPKAPAFPVTTIRLNRFMPEVKLVLGLADDSESGFRPVSIQGEPLSATILRERR
jgi:hypothetical protein